MSGDQTVRFILYYRENSEKCAEILDLYDSIEHKHLRDSIRLQDVDRLKASLKQKGQSLPAFITGVPLLTTNIKEAKRRVWLGPSAVSMMTEMMKRVSDNMQRSYDKMPNSMDTWASEGHSGRKNESILKGHMVARSTANELGGTAASIVSDELYWSERVGNKLHGSGNRSNAKISDSDIAKYHAECQRTAPRRLRENEANWNSR